MKNEILFKIKS